MGLKLRQRILDLLFPPCCVFCGALTKAGGLCPDCESALPYTGEYALQEGTGFGQCAAPFYYEGLVRDSLLRYKFQNRDCYAETYGELLAACAAEEFSGEFDIVTWVPVSAQRKRQRGYDQAELLARNMCRRWQVEPLRLLEKVTDNPAQSGISSPEQRRANVLGVYEERNAVQLAGKRVLLVDDILTTGSTLAEASRVLRAAGASKVICLTLAMKREEKPDTNRKVM